MSRLSRCVVLALLVGGPANAFAQAAITGVVRDGSGGVLPGVTVEASSPALIERTRVVVTDATGQFRVVDLRPGTYAVTFTLPGFRTVRRDGVELTGSFVATLDAELAVGDLEETITVSADTPTVDVQNARLQQTLSRETLTAVPTSRTAVGIQSLIPGLVGSVNSSLDVGGVAGASGGGAMSIHGGRPIDSRTLNDGLTTNHAGGGGGGGNNANIAGAQEVVISTSGGLGEAETGGVTINLVPRDGGNTFTGTFVVSGTNGSFQGDNLTPALRDRGLTGSAQILKVYDVNPMGGGRIVRDKLWFFFTERVWGAENTVPGLFVNKHAGNPDAWTYEPDLTKPAFTDSVNRTHVLRLTWQATPRHKLSAYWSEQPSLMNNRGGGSVTTNAGAGGGLTGSNQTIEATANNNFTPSRIQQVTWSSPLTNRVLLEAGFGGFFARYGNGWGSGGRTDGTFNPEMIRVVEQSGALPGLAFRAPVVYQRSRVATRTWRASVSYVTGAHNMKFGYFGGYTNPSSGQFYYDQLIAYRFNNGVPNQLTQTGIYPHMITYTRNLIPTALYAQDQWTTSRLTVQGGLRYDHLTTSYPEQRVGGTPIIANEIVFPAGSTPGIHWNDVTPRLGLAYDLFGNRRTAVKFNIGKYMESYVVGSASDNDLNPLARIAVSTTRSWNDVNRNYVPDCDLANPNANDECGDMANKALGTNTVNRTWDPGYIDGWGKRPFNWEMGLSVQQQLVPRVSVSAGYFRRWFGNWYVTRNRATSASDWTPFSITAPQDQRLPGGGGYTIDGLYNLVPGKVGQVDEYSAASNSVESQTENWHGFDFGVNARLPLGLTVQGGGSTGRRKTDNCAIRQLVPELGSGGTFAGQNDTRPPVTINTASPTDPYCRVVEPFITDWRGLSSYTVPTLDVLLSLTWQSYSGPELGANYVVPNAAVRPSLGRDLSGGAANITVNLVAPATLYGDRINQFDMRVAKIIRLGRTRTQVGIDVFNLTNTDTPLTYSSAFVPNGTWLRPTSLLPARFLKFSAQVDF